MKKISEFIWPIVGFAAVVVSGYFLYQELKTTSLADVWSAVLAIPPHRILFAALSTLVSLCSFTTYALSHNIGASVFSGALVRYRAYTAKGLSAAQVAVLVALCSFTFFLGTILLGGFTLVYDPHLLERLKDKLPAVLTDSKTAVVVGIGLLAFVAVYVAGSLLRLPPLSLRKFKLEYPRPAIMLRQLAAAPLELLGAAGIIYFALPDAVNPGFVPVLAIFLASFSVALASHAPGGLGVFEIVFLTAMNITVADEPRKNAVIAALLVFRVFYFWIPALVSVIVVVAFERSRLAAAIGAAGRALPAGPVPEPPVVLPGLDAHELERALKEKAV